MGAMPRYLVLSVCLLAPVPMAQADTASAHVGATIVAAASVGASAGLSFGHIAAGSTGGVVALQPDGGHAIRGDLAARGGPVRAACLRIVAPPGVAYTLLLPEIVLMQGPPGAPPLVADSFAIASGDAGLSGRGDAVVYIGATAHIAPNQAPGLYRGDLPVQVCYQ